MLHLFSNKNAFFYVMDPYPATFHVNHVTLWCVEKTQVLFRSASPPEPAEFLREAALVTLCRRGRFLGALHVLMFTRELRGSSHLVSGVASNHPHILAMNGHLEEEQLCLGDLLTMVVNHLLIGMILQESSITGW